MRGFPLMPFDHSAAAVPVPLPTAVPLTEAVAGTRVRVVAVSGGGGIQRRLIELGLLRGAELAVVGRMGRRGAVIVAAHGTRLVVGVGMAERISVAAIVA